MILYVVRHGESVFNLQNRYAGSTDCPLTPKGIEQAEELSQKLSELSEINFDIIIASPLLRARKTAEIINENLNLPLILSDEFKERDLGVYEGLIRDEAKEKYPDLWAKDCLRQLDDAPTDGETIRQLDKRVIQALLKLEQEYPEKSVLLVTHGGVAMTINRYYNNLSFDEMYSGFRLGNCEIVKYIQGEKSC